jgi:hypothetical protein
MANKRVKFRKNIQERVDQDYQSKLSPTEKEFLSKFNREYYAGEYAKPDSLHSKLSVKKELSDAMNASNRDVLSIAKCQPNKTVNVDSFEIEVESKLTTDDLSPSQLFEFFGEKKAAEILFDQALDDLKTTTEKKDAIQVLKNLILNMAKIVAAKKRENRNLRIKHPNSSIGSTDT